MSSQSYTPPLFFFAAQVSGDTIKIPKYFMVLPEGGKWSGGPIVKEENPKLFTTLIYPKSNIPETISKNYDWDNSEFSRIYLWEICRPFDGILISLAYLTGKRLKKSIEDGIKKTYRIPSNIPVLCDCGAWQYKHLDEVPYKPEEIVDYYESFKCEYGITLDQLVLKSKLTWKDKGVTKSRTLTREDHIKRMEFSLNSEKIMKEVSSDKIELFGSVQGSLIDDYVSMTDKYLSIGFDNIAIGGVAKTTTKKIKLILNSVSSTIEDYGLERKIKIHVLGVGRPSIWEFYKNTGIFSFDTSRFHTTAWIKGEYVFWDGFKLNSYDVRKYDYREYHQNPPIPDCDCPVCKSVGCDQDGIPWPKRFGTNQRNMSRGFHNLWYWYHYYMTVIKGTLVLIGCSQKKLNYKTVAKNLYQGRLFKLAKTYAERNNYDYCIISAKHGLIHPNEHIEPYNKTISSKKDIEELRFTTLPELSYLLPNYGRIIVFAGARYREILKPIWDSRFTYPKSKGYGDFCKKIKELTPNPKLDEFWKEKPPIEDSLNFKSMSISAFCEESDIATKPVDQEGE